MKRKEINIQIDNLQIIVIKQGEYYVCYSHALDFSSYGETSDLAKKRFSEAVEIFFEETFEKGTLVKELESLGWQVDVRKSQYLPPMMVESSLQPVSFNLHA